MRKRLVVLLTAILLMLAPVRSAWAAELAAGIAPVPQISACQNEENDGEDPDDGHPEDPWKPRR